MVVWVLLGVDVGGADERESAACVCVFVRPSVRVRVCVCVGGGRGNTGGLNLPAQLTAPTERGTGLPTYSPTSQTSVTPPHTALQHDTGRPEPQNWVCEARATGRHSTHSAPSIPATQACRDHMNSWDRNVLTICRSLPLLTPNT